MSEKKYDFGLVGLGVMGRNFILNVAENKFSAIGLDMDAEKAKAMDDEASQHGFDAKGTTSKEEFVQSLKTPRVIMMLVPAGSPVDSVINDLLPMLEKGDLLIDGGNSFYTDTDRREKYLAEKGIHFMGAGVSGGAKGARLGPSIMPGGPEESWQMVKPIFEAVAAKVNGEPCVTYIGPRSSGNYVKMVHNGIEYGLMQLISEVYDFMKRGLGINIQQMHETFRKWNDGKLHSFLMEITAKIFTKKDEYSDQPLVEMILDKGKQKGTGKWTSQNAMDLGVPLMTIDMSVNMREISALKDERIQAEKLYPVKPWKTSLSLDKEKTLMLLEDALYFAYIISYSQGLSMLANASEEYKYNLNLAEIAKIWRGGCIIRAALLEDFMQAYRQQPGLRNPLLSPIIAEKVMQVQGAARQIAKDSLDMGIVMPCMLASLAYFDAYRTARLPLNLVQAQRDFFGSHTYERIDREGIFHTEWE
ncbi:MAG: NADP-dependent phosphogluconate dehydrogenase [Cytophagaceae bacterium]|nr:NADP-dependent phosphogluconate dehydrogenase [Cytophagaceae bacterium]MDW8456085.1 NADP-dependent phosphogluconate dehydrogenase [Cytophagaceae bacterium]